MEHTEPINKELLIVNSSGGLIYSSINNVNTNDLLVMGSTIHSLFQIANEFFQEETNKFIAEYENHSIHIYRTLSKTYFIFLWDKTEPPFQKIYLHFAEIVMTNYLYTVEMPIVETNFEPKKYFESKAPNQLK